jgi:hypothetical protein
LYYVQGPYNQLKHRMIEHREVKALISGVTTIQETTRSNVCYRYNMETGDPGG